MSVVVAVMIVFAILCMSIGLIAALATWFAQRPRSTPLEQVYWSFTVWSYVLGGILITAPNWWFGPTWSYFQSIPHNGIMMGVVLVVLAVLQTVVMLIHNSRQTKLLSLLFFLNGFVYWTAGCILGAEGLSGHMGLMEAPFMMYAGAHLFTHSAALMAQERVGLGGPLSETLIEALDEALDGDGIDDV